MICSDNILNTGTQIDADWLSFVMICFATELFHLSDSIIINHNQSAFICVPVFHDHHENLRSLSFLVIVHFILPAKKKLVRINLLMVQLGEFKDRSEGEFSSLCLSTAVHI